MTNKIEFMLMALSAMSLPSSVEAQLSPSIGNVEVTRTTGAVHLDILTGRVEGRVCIANRPTKVAGAFVLNAGLNVTRITDGSGKAVSYEGWYEPGIDGEARVYTVSDAPPVLCIQYVGAFPVYSAHDAPNDFKGMMAFNGDSARFAEQSAWLPTPYDDTAKVRGGDTAYDLNISCQGCRFLYMNGGGIIMRERGRFFSTIARPVLLFGGKGPLTKTANVTILNDDVPIAQADALSTTVGQIAAYYRGYMGRPVADQPTFLRMVTIDQVDRDRRQGEWGFATWPTIAMSGSVGNVGKALLDGGDKAQARVQYIAHEMGHYYFGTLTSPRGPYFWFLLESTAEYLSIKALRAISGDTAANRYVMRLVSNVEKEKGPFTALDRIENSSTIGQTYRYSYGPLLLLDLEKQVGESKMRAFMQGLLSARNVQSWNDLRDIAVDAGISKELWERWRTTCVEGGRRTCV